MKRYRTVRILYGATTLEIDVPTSMEAVSRDEIASIRQTLDGSRYKQITGSSMTYAYNIPRCDQDIIDFFNTAYTASLTQDITLSREQDDGSYESVAVVMDKPQYQEEDVGTGFKSYSGLNVRFYSA